VSVKTINLRPDEEYITLQSLLKVSNVISTGGMAKIFLEENEVRVNGELENRRGRTLYKGDRIDLENQSFVIK
jgi:ribosome-associated protein